MVSYTRLLVAALLGVGAPLYLILQGTMDNGIRIASGAVLLSLLALFVYSGRQPLPKSPAVPRVTIEDDGADEESIPAPVTELDGTSQKRDEKIKRSRGRVAAPVAPTMPMPPMPMPAPGAPLPPAVGIASPPPMDQPSLPEPPAMPPMPQAGVPPALPADGSTVAQRLIVDSDAQSQMETEIETFVVQRREKRAEIRSRIERRRRMALAERRAAKVRMWTELEDGEDLGTFTISISTAASGGMFGEGGTAGGDPCRGATHAGRWGAHLVNEDNAVCSTIIPLHFWVVANLQTVCTP